MLKRLFALFSSKAAPGPVKEEPKKSEFSRAATPPSRPLPRPANDRPASRPSRSSSSTRSSSTDSSTIIPIPYDTSPTHHTPSSPSHDTFTSGGGGSFGGGGASGDWGGGGGSCDSGGGGGDSGGGGGGCDCSADINDDVTTRRLQRRAGLNIR